MCLIHIVPKKLELKCQYAIKLLKSGSVANV